MKFINLTGIASILLFLPLLFQSCVKDECKEFVTYDKYIPIYKSIDEIRIFEVADPKALKTPGKIYYYKDYLLINELNEGIHVFDNREPSNPVQIAFLNIPGNVDMAVQNDILYADNYMDLVAVNISDPGSPKFLERQQDLFQNYHFIQGQGWYVGYEIETVTEEMDCNNFSRRGGVVDLAFDNSSWETNGGGIPTASGAGNVTGTGGSMARFTITQNRLYTLESSKIQVFNLGANGSPVKSTDLTLDWGMETIFPYQNYLFLGANDGVYIYDNSDPDAPQFLSKFEHARSCDPVYVSEDIAFVTLNGNGGCEGFENQLDVLDVTDLTAPKLIKTYPMTDPKGLSVVDKSLFLCDGKDGLKTFDISDLENIDKNQIGHFDDFDTYDVIALSQNNLLLVIGPDGFFQMDASNASDMKVLSVIPIEK